MLTVSSCTLLLSVVTAIPGLALGTRQLWYIGLLIAALVLIVVGVHAAGANRQDSEERAQRMRAHTQPQRRTPVR